MLRRLPEEHERPAALSAQTSQPSHAASATETAAGARALAGASQAPNVLGRPIPSPSFRALHTTSGSKENARGTPHHEASLLPLPLSANTQTIAEAPLPREPYTLVGPADAGEPGIPHNPPAVLVPGEDDRVNDAGIVNPRHHVSQHAPSSVDVMLALGGTFLTSRSSQTDGSERRTQTATHAIAAVGAFHQQFRSALGYRLTLSYTRPEFDYTYEGSGSGIDTRIFEAAGTYVVQGPHRGKVTTSADAGAALLAFLPTARASAVSNAYRSAAVLGANVDYAISRRLTARVTYRAQIFRGPNFGDPSGLVPVTTGVVVVSNEPAVGIVYRFGVGKPGRTAP